MKHIKIALISIALCALTGCATIPATTAIALGTLGVAAGSLAVTAIHDCRTDGACKKAPLPK